MCCHHERGGPDPVPYLGNAKASEQLAKGGKGVVQAPDSQGTDKRGRGGELESE
jgi:hypothetical protein